MIFMENFGICYKAAVLCAEISRTELQIAREIRNFFQTPQMAVM
jgi:hypothetical protein